MFKFTRAVFILIGLTNLATLTACLFPGGGPEVDWEDVNPEDIVGIAFYGLVGALPDDIKVVTFAETSWKAQQTHQEVYSSPAKKEFTSNVSGTMTKTSTTAKAIAQGLAAGFFPAKGATLSQYDFEVTAITLTPTDASGVTYFNSQGRCGFTDWALNVEKEIKVTEAMPAEATTTVAAKCPELYNYPLWGNAGDPLPNDLSSTWYTDAGKVIAQGPGTKFYNLLSVEKVDYSGTIKKVLRIGDTSDTRYDAKEKTRRPRMLSEAQYVEGEAI